MKALRRAQSRWFGSRKDGKLTWYDPGPINPFGVRFLDVRSTTQTLLSTTLSQEIAQSYADLRSSDGSDLKSIRIEDAVTVDCNLHVPHDGSEIDGIVFKSEAMEEKWDIYAYDSAFFFSRSWTGQLVYRAIFEIESDGIRVGKVEASREQSATAVQCVYFLLASHAKDHEFPHPITNATSDDPEQIALVSFNVFGNRACYATFDDITHISIPI